MVRPKRLRRINQIPQLRGFKPIGNGNDCADENVVILLEEYEALRLSIYNGLPHDTAASEMNVSRPTFTRILNECFKKISMAFIEGKMIVIDGGEFEFSDRVKCCNACRKPGKMGEHSCNENRKRKDDTTELEVIGIADDDVCFCPECDYSLKHTSGNPCCDERCPNCDLPLMKNKF